MYKYLKVTVLEQVNVYEYQKSYICNVKVSDVNMKPSRTCDRDDLLVTGSRRP